MPATGRLLPAGRSRGGAPGSRTGGAARRWGPHPKDGCRAGTGIRTCCCCYFLRRRHGSGFQGLRRRRCCCSRQRRPADVPRHSSGGSALRRAGGLLKAPGSAASSASALPSWRGGERKEREEDCDTWRRRGLKLEFQFEEGEEREECYRKFL